MRVAASANPASVTCACRGEKGSSSSSVQGATCFGASHATCTTRLTVPACGNQPKQQQGRADSSCHAHAVIQANRRCNLMQTCHKHPNVPYAIPRSKQALQPSAILTPTRTPLTCECCKLSLVRDASASTTHTSSASTPPAYPTRLSFSRLLQHRSVACRGPCSTGASAGTFSQSRERLSSREHQSAGIKGAKPKPLRGNAVIAELKLSSELGAGLIASPWSGEDPSRLSESVISSKVLLHGLQLLIQPCLPLLLLLLGLSRLSRAMADATLL